MKPTSTQTGKDVYTIKQIANWVNDNEVVLPGVQRGFVWRPYQIENLWDSLLRGFPVGAFVLSSDETGAKHELLDGQQRATAICLGFGLNTFRDSQEYIRVFIDLEPPSADDPRKFIFRVITKYHPWGYQLEDNTKPLTAENIRKALDLYQCNDYLAKPLGDFFPFKATLPLPFSWFIEAAEENADWSYVHSKIQNEAEYWPARFEEWKAKNPDCKFGLQVLLNRVLDATKRMLKEQKIPALYLNFQTLSSSSPESNFSSTIEPRSESDKIDEIENLFIRLNAGGTPLRGEELNYSILKAHLSSTKLKNLEDACDGIMRPSRFITLAYRLFSVHESTPTAPVLTIQPKYFQRAISERLSDFEGFLETLLAEKLLVEIRNLLLFDASENQAGFPYLLFRKITDEAPEVIFILLYRLWEKKDRFEKNNSEHLPVLGMLSLFLFFGKQGKQRDYRGLLSGVWGNLKDLDQTEFWSKKSLPAGISQFLDGFKIKEGGKQSPAIDLTQLDESLSLFEQAYKGNGQINEFFKAMFFNRSLLLYAQRHFLAKHFKDIQFQLEDSHRPFDWDHLFPQQYIKNRQGIPKLLRSIYQSNGNLRAWPFELNREDQNQSPAQKLKPLEPSQFKDLMTKHDFEDDTKLPELLCALSFCTPEWQQAYHRKLEQDWMPPFLLIFQRNLLLIEHWYEELQIKNLIS